MYPILAHAHVFCSGIDMFIVGCHVTHHQAHPTCGQFQIDTAFYGLYPIRMLWSNTLLKSEAIYST